MRDEYSCIKGPINYSEVNLLVGGVLATSYSTPTMRVIYSYIDIGVRKALKL